MARDFIVREEGPIPQERKAVGRAVVAELHDVGGDFAGRVVPVVKLEGVVDLPAILGEVVEIADKVLGEFVGQFDVAATGDTAEPAKDGGGTGQAAVTERETRLEPVADLVDVAVGHLKGEFKGGVRDDGRRGRREESVNGFFDGHFGGVHGSGLKTRTMASMTPTPRRAPRLTAAM